MGEEMVTISKAEYDELKSDSKFLGLLRSYGVDNWDGYEFAIDDMGEDE